MYYSDFYSDIPLGIVSKKLTGCGLTSFALENNKPTVVVVPTVALIQNKVAQYPNERRKEKVVGLYADIPIQSIADYIAKTEVPKVLVTYDSFHKLRNLITDDYHVVVDEFHNLLDAYSYRDEGINKLINSLKNYSKISYVSATPTKLEYLPPFLANLPYTELEWDDIVPVTVYPTQSKKPLSAVYNIIKKYRLGLVEINSHKSEAGYLFINSVTLIKQIIKKANLLPSEVRVICANNDDNKKKLGANYKIETPLDPEKMINFVTSTAYEGTDFYSATGVAYVISTNTSLNTLLTIDTQIFQIAGRIRNADNPFKHIIYHVFNESPLKLTQEEFDLIVDKKIKDTEFLVDEFLQCDQQTRELKLRNTIIGTVNYLYTPDNIFAFDHLQHKNEIRIWECIILPYQSGLYVTNSYNDDSRFCVEEDASVLQNKGKFLMSSDFTTVCKMLYDGFGDLKLARRQFPLLDKAYDAIGLEGMRCLSYNATKINQALQAINKKDLLKEEIYKNFTTGRHTIPDVKQMIQKVYDDNGIVKKAKATDLEEVFGIKPTNTKINGKCTRVYIIP